MAKECGLCRVSAGLVTLDRAGLCASCWETVNWFSHRSTN